mmetsp:Transcript_11562/g.29315  ORF Transcript_11562/g.29315 Transcript_11562/m.29315 type:complete len:90 (+) Transcript_11562:232-501(+)
MTPWSTTAMTSAFWMVDRRWAMTILVVLLSAAMRRSRVCCTMRSLSLSRAEVASSRSRTRGLRMRQRARQMRCFWPPESCEPFSPTSVW